DRSHGVPGDGGAAVVRGRRPGDRRLRDAGRGRHGPRRIRGIDAPPGSPAQIDVLVEVVASAAGQGAQDGGGGGDDDSLSRDRIPRPRAVVPRMLGLPLPLPSRYACARPSASLWRPSPPSPARPPGPRPCTCEWWSTRAWRPPASSSTWTPAPAPGNSA